MYIINKQKDFFLCGLSGMVCPPCPLFALLYMKTRANVREISLLPSDVYYDNTDDGGIKGDLRLHVGGKSRLYSSHKTSEAVINFVKNRRWGRNLHCTPKVSNPLFPVWNSS
jgi:hypothetical protein